MSRTYRKRSRTLPPANEGLKAVVGAGVVMLLAGLCMAASTLHV
jgi:hypothetical protein